MGFLQKKVVIKEETMLLLLFLFLSLMFSFFFKEKILTFFILLFTISFISIFIAVLEKKKDKKDVLKNCFSIISSLITTTIFIFIFNKIFLHTYYNTLSLIIIYSTITALSFSFSTIFFKNNTEKLLKHNFKKVSLNIDTKKFLLLSTITFFIIFTTTYSIYTYNYNNNNKTLSKSYFKSLNELDVALKKIPSKTNLEFLRTIKKELFRIQSEMIEKKEEFKYKKDYIITPKKEKLLEEKKESIIKAVISEIIFTQYLKYDFKKDYEIVNNLTYKEKKALLKNLTLQLKELNTTNQSEKKVDFCKDTDLYEKGFLIENLYYDIYEHTTSFNYFCKTYSFVTTEFLKSEVLKYVIKENYTDIDSKLLQKKFLIKILKKQQ